MLQRILMTGCAVLGTSMSFGMSLVGAVSLAKPAVVPISPTTELKIYELCINAPSSSGSDDGKEYIEIKNTSASTMAIEDVYLVYIDGETSENGEVDCLLRLGTNGGASTVGGSGARNLAPGEVMVIRDTSGGAPLAMTPSGGTVVSINFDTASQFNSDPLKNSCGMFALVTGINNIAPGDHKDTSPANGILDSTYWANTLDVVDIRQDTGSTYYSNSTLNGTGFNKVQCALQSTWTPDGFSRLNTGSNYAQGLIYDLKDAPGGFPPYHFIPATPEYAFAVFNATTPFTTVGVVEATPGLTGQFSVTNGSGGGTTWQH